MYRIFSGEQVCVVVLGRTSLCGCFFRENMFVDCIRGIFVVACSLCAFISIVWLREQVLHGGGPEWAVGAPEPARPAQNAAAPANNNQRAANVQVSPFN